MNYFLWPNPQFALSKLSFDPAINSEAVEDRFEQVYPNAKAVLFSSGRAALSALMEVLNLSRGHKVWVPPFASHCVLDAVSRRATPTPDYKDTGISAFIVFHQWGFIHQADVRSEIIEDSADSLLCPGAKLFPNGGRFEVISLPKTLGALVGGVVFCREQDDAEVLRRLRDKRGNGGLTQLLLRALGSRRARIHAYWQGFESDNGGIPTILCSDIMRQLNRIDTLIADRKRKWDQLAEFAPSWVHLSSGRFPCNVPVTPTSGLAEKLEAAGITSGSRNFNRNMDIRSPDLTAVLPVPIHQQVPIDHIAAWKHLLNAERTPTAQAVTQIHR